MRGENEHDVKPRKTKQECKGCALLVQKAGLRAHAGQLGLVYSLIKALFEIAINLVVVYELIRSAPAIYSRFFQVSKHAFHAEKKPA
jgi:hypothetical protein